MMIGKEKLAVGDDKATERFVTRLWPSSANDVGLAAYQRAFTDYVVLAFTTISISATHYKDDQTKHTYRLLMLMRP